MYTSHSTTAEKILSITFHSVYRKGGLIQMKTSIEAYVEYLCSICKNKQTDMCCIRRKIDNTMYCSSYESNVVKRKKTSSNWMVND
jgi:hypothetical protein